MKIISAKDYQALSRAAANIISAQVILKPSCVLGLATGSSPVGTYQQLIEWYKKGDLDFSQVRTVNLDEYVGLDKDHDQSYAYFMRTNLFDHINVDPANTNPRPHHGHPGDPSGPPGADGGLRRQQGPGHQGRFLRPRHSPGPCLHPSVPPRLHPGG